MDSILQSEKECWKDIIGYKGVYQISNLGNVRTAERYVKQSNCCRKFKSILMSPTDNGNGYLIVGLRKNHNRKSFYIHRLVAEHFIGNIPSDKVVNHKDLNKLNNNAENLEIISQKENVCYSVRSMLKPHKSWKTSNTGYKSIYLRYGKFRVNIPRIKFDKSFINLSDAISARDKLIDKSIRGEII